MVEHRDVMTNGFVHRTPSVMSAAPGVVFSVKELQKAPGLALQRANLAEAMRTNQSYLETALPTAPVSIPLGARSKYGYHAFLLLSF